MKAKIYIDPFTKKHFMGEAELLEVYEPVKKLKRNSTNSEIANYHLFNYNNGLKKAKVKFLDNGEITDNMVFDPKDIINN